MTNATETVKAPPSAAAGDHFVLQFEFDGVPTYRRLPSEQAVLAFIFQTFEQHHFAMQHGHIADQTPLPISDQDELQYRIEEGTAENANEEEENDNENEDDDDDENDELAVLRYDTSDLFNFFDGQFQDVAVLHFVAADKKYDVKGRQWLKNRMYESLNNAANAAQAARERDRRQQQREIAQADAAAAAAAVKS